MAVKQRREEMGVRRGVVLYYSLLFFFIPSFFSVSSITSSSFLFNPFDCLFSLIGSFEMEVGDSWEICDIPKCEISSFLRRLLKHS